MAEDTDILICAKCLDRIWRHSDGGHFVDNFVEDRHINCMASVESNRKAREVRPKSL